MRNVMKRLFKDEKGLETVEYAVIAGLVVVGIIATITSIGTWVHAKFTALESGLSGAAP